MSNMWIDRTGQKFNHLTLLAYARPGGRGVGAIWRVRCDCGTIREMEVKDIVHQKRKTCGKCEFTRELRRTASLNNPWNRRNFKDGKAQERALLARYRKQAVEKNREWNLTPEEFRNLTQQNCSYCGAELSSRLKKYKYNGIDRVDNQLGYTPENSVTCCGICNKMKGAMSAGDFLRHVIVIAQQFMKRECENCQKNI